MDLVRTDVARLDKQRIFYSVMMRLPGNDDILCA